MNGVYQVPTSRLAHDHEPTQDMPREETADDNVSDLADRSRSRCSARAHNHSHKRQQQLLLPYQRQPHPAAHPHQDHDCGRHVTLPDNITLRDHENRANAEEVVVDKRERGGKRWKDGDAR